MCVAPVFPLMIQDVDALLSLDAQTFSEAIFTQEMLEHLLQMPHCVGYKILHEEKLKGYVLFSFFEDSAEILSISVDPEHQKQGYGYCLLSYGLAQLKKVGVCSCLLEVRQSNHAAQKLYKRFGAKKVGERKEYYQHPTENADVLQISL